MQSFVCFGDLTSLGTWKTGIETSNPRVWVVPRTAQVSLK